MPIAGSQIEFLLYAGYLAADILAMVIDKVRMYEEIMMNEDNLESSLLTSNLLKMMSVTS